MGYSEPPLYFGSVRWQVSSVLENFKFNPKVEYANNKGIMSVSFISGRTRDSLHLVYKDYRYSKDRSRNGVTYWRCMYSRKTSLNPQICKARLSTDAQGNILSYGREHNHPANSLEIQIRTCISNIKRLSDVRKMEDIHPEEKEQIKNLINNISSSILYSEDIARHFRALKHEGERLLSMSAAFESHIDKNIDHQIGPPSASINVSIDPAKSAYSPSRGVVLAPPELATSPLSVGSGAMLTSMEQSVSMPTSSERMSVQSPRLATGHLPTFSLANVGKRDNGNGDPGETGFLQPTPQCHDQQSNQLESSLGNLAISSSISPPINTLTQDQKIAILATHPYLCTVPHSTSGLAVAGNIGSNIHVISEPDSSIPLTNSVNTLPSHTKSRLLNNSLTKTSSESSPLAVMLQCNINSNNPAQVSTGSFRGDRLASFPASKPYPHTKLQGGPMRTSQCHGGVLRNSPYTNVTLAQRYGYHDNMPCNLKPHGDHATFQSNNFEYAVLNNHMQHGGRTHSQLVRFLKTLSPEEICILSKSLPILKSKPGTRTTTDFNSADKGVS